MSGCRRDGGLPVRLLRYSAGALVVEYCWLWVAGAVACRLLGRPEVGAVALPVDVGEWAEV